MQILSINVGRAQPLATREGSVMSAIGKQAVGGEPTPVKVRVHRLGIDGDEQADLSVHGGQRRSVGRGAPPERGSTREGEHKPAQVKVRVHRLGIDGDEQADLSVHGGQRRSVGRGAPPERGSTREGEHKPAQVKVRVHRLGIDGDEQADLSVHGGLSKAIYAYPHEHYVVWANLCQQAGGKSAIPSEVLEVDTLRFGALGENLTLQGLTEKQVWVGDQLHFADCVLTVTEPRLPCFKFNLRMGFSHAAKMMVQSGMCGFYLAVLREGRLSPGEAFELKPGPREVSIPELFELRTRKAKQLDMF
jgi:MOSC domain-containing protein YiiM